jgi:2-keto-3-deoxy-L-rhamnonate aldolase RhmA
MISPRAAKAFLERATSGKICFGVHHSAISPQLVEMYGYLGIDYVIIGTEVESVDRGVMENLMRAADASGTAPIVKMLRNDGRLIEEAMNYGAPLVTVPHIYTRAHLDAAVKSSRFQPHGTRGICPVARYNGYGIRNLDETHAMAETARSVIPIIEDAEALDHLDEMMSSSDVDIFEVGPFDLSQSLGVKRELTYANRETMAAIEKIAAAARRHKKGVLVPLWLSDDADSPSKLLRKQIDELASRGITIFYAIEMVMMGRLLRDLTKIRDAL